MYKIIDMYKTISPSTVLLWCKSRTDQTPAADKVVYTTVTVLQVEH